MPRFQANRRVLAILAVFFFITTLYFCMTRLSAMDLIRQPPREAIFPAEHPVVGSKGAKSQAASQDLSHSDTEDMSHQADHGGVEEEDEKDEHKTKDTSKAEDDEAEKEDEQEDIKQEEEEKVNKVEGKEEKKTEEKGGKKDDEKKDEVDDPDGEDESDEKEQGFEEEESQDQSKQDDEAEGAVEEDKDEDAGEVDKLVSKEHANKEAESEDDETSGKEEKNEHKAHTDEKEKELEKQAEEEDKEVEEGHKPIPHGLLLHAALPEEHIPTIKNNKRLILIGDIHGMLKPLKALLRKADFDPSTDHIISVGDMINKGPSSSGVLSLLMKHGASAVRGNHEDRILSALNSTALSSAGMPTGKKADAQALETALSLTEEQVDWLETRPAILSIDQLRMYVAHAGMLPGVRLEDQPAWAVMNMRTIMHEQKSELRRSASSEGESEEAKDESAGEGQKKAKGKKKREKKFEKRSDERAPEQVEEAENKHERKADKHVEKETSEEQADKHVVENKHEKKAEKLEEEENNKHEEKAGKAEGEKENKKEEEKQEVKEKKNVKKHANESEEPQKAKVKKESRHESGLVALDTREGEKWARAWNRYQRHLNGLDRWTVVYGHDARRGLVEARYTIGLDSGCVKGGALTGMVVEGEEGGSWRYEVVQVRCGDDDEEDE